MPSAGHGSRERSTPRRRACARAALGGLVAVTAALPAAAQLAPPVTQPQRQGQSLAAPKTEQLSRSQPVTFLADHVDYDRERGIVTATGHVEAWQQDQILRADKVTFDRTTGVMAAIGHVQMIEPDGEVLFSDYAELTSDMKQGVLKTMRALLTANGRLAANGARRTPGPINTMSKAVYSTCNLCAAHPDRPPSWDLRARVAVQDVPNKRIEYYNAWLDVMGVPVLYLPYFSNADPSVKRQSGFLVPSIGNSTHLGAFTSLPYYWVLGKSSDITIDPLIGTGNAGQIETIYRRAFNNGSINIDDALAYDQNEPQGFLFATGRFVYNDTWRYGFNVDIASGITYLRDFNVGNLIGNTLNSQVFAEGFGEGAYAKISALTYQGLNSTVTDSQLPYVLPRYQYSYVGLPNVFGGRISVDSNDFNVVRTSGTNDQRVNLDLQWERTGIGRLGDVWTITLRDDNVAYNGYDLNQQPNYAGVGKASAARSEPTVAVKLAWPFVRTGGGTGSLLVEPIAQLIAAPNTGAGTYAKLPNEDSLAPEFSDMTLFSLNRFTGVDRQEGGVRANVGLHMTWTTKIGVFDSLVGQSYRLHADDTVPAYVGLGRHVSDVVGRLSWTPSQFLDLTARARADHENFNIHYAEGVASVGPSWLRLSGGYIYSSTTPYFLDFQPPQGIVNEPRNEASLALATKYGHYRLSGYARRDLQHDQMVDTGVDGAYEDECLIFDVRFYRRYTSINNDHGASTVLFTITLKTVGAFGFHAA